MSRQNQNDQNQMGVPYQLIYQDPKTFFSDIWNAKTHKLELPFLKVSASIEKISHQPVLEDASGWQFSLSFHICGKVVNDLPPNTLCLDVGNRFCTGILDHHQLEKDPDKRRIIRNHSASSLVYDFPQMITEAIEGEKPTSIEIYLPKRPDFDAVTATYLAVYYLIHQHFPTGSQFTVDYARMQAEGNTPYIERFSLATSPSAILYIANAISKKSLLKHKEINKIADKDINFILDNLMLLNGLAVLDTIFAEFHQNGLKENDSLFDYYNHIHTLFQREKFKSFSDAIKNDYLKYLKDAKRAETYIVTAQYDDVKALFKEMREKVENPGTQGYEQLFQILENRIPQLSNPNDELLSETYDWMLKKLDHQQKKNEDPPDNSDESRQKVKIKEKLQQLRQEVDSRGMAPNTDIKHRYGNANMIVLENPEAILFKEWARLDRLHCSNELKRKGFEIIFSIVTHSDIHQGHRFVISVNPRSNLTLKSISMKLEQEEKRNRQQAYLCRLGERNRPGYNNPDPWFDGRGTVMEGTIVDTPGGGTLIDKKRIKQIVYEELKVHKSIFSGNLCFVSKIIIKNIAFDGEINAVDDLKHYKRFFYRNAYHWLSTRFLRLDMEKLQKAGLKVLRQFVEGDIQVDLQGIQLLRVAPDSAVLSIDCAITSSSSLKLFPITDSLVSRVCKRINEQINKEIYKAFSGSDETPEQHMLRFFKIGEGKQFYKTGEMVQESSEAYYNIFQQKSTFSIPKKDYLEFYKMVQLIAMYAYYLKNFIMSIDSQIEEYMKDKHLRLDKIESLRQALMRYLSQEYSVETTPIARYSGIWKQFLEEFEIDKYIQEAKWQCTELSNYYIENQSFKTSRGVAILSWIIAPISIVMGILQLNSENLKPIVIGKWPIDPTSFWLGVTLLFSFIGYTTFPRLWAFFKKKWKKRKKRKKG